MIHKDIIKKDLAEKCFCREKFKIPANVVTHCLKQHCKNYRDNTETSK